MASPSTSASAGSSEVDHRRVRSRGLGPHRQVAQRGAGTGRVVAGGEVHLVAGDDRLGQRRVDVGPPSSPTLDVGDGQAVSLGLARVLPAPPPSWNQHPRATRRPPRRQPTAARGGTPTTRAATVRRSSIDHPQTPLTTPAPHDPAAANYTPAVPGRARGLTSTSPSHRPFPGASGPSRAGVRPGWELPQAQQAP